MDNSRKNHRYRSGAGKAGLLSDQSGQSAIEYLVICGVLIMALITVPSFYGTMSHTMKNKYQSYYFGVAISDPPRKAFDDAVNQDADKVSRIIKDIQKIGEFIEDVIIPDILKPKLPSQSEIEQFLELLKSLFS